MKVKLYCIMAKDSMDKIKGVRGKMITQGGHGFLHAVWDAEKRFPEAAQAYRDSDRAYKITLVVPTTDDLLILMERYRDICGVSLVTDAGLTVFKDENGEPCPVTTCLGIGPIFENDIGDDLKALRTFT